MGFKEVTSERQYRAWKEWKIGDFIEGKYIEQGEVETKYGMQRWFDVKLSDSSMDVNTSKVFRLNGTGSLDNKMDEVEINDEIKVIYEGLKVLERGNFKGKEFHDVKVLVAEKEKETTDVDHSDL